MVLVAVLAVSIVGQGVGLAALVFSGPLAGGRAVATASFVLGGGVAAAFLAQRSRTTPLISVPQDAPAIVLVAVISALLVKEPGLGPGSIMGLLAASTCAAGVAMLAIGRFGLGESVRYLPTVVVQGFVAGTGWLLVRGGIEVAAGRSFGIDEFGDLLGAESAGRWIPALALAVIVVGLGEAKRFPVWAPSFAIVVATVAFYAVVFVVSSPRAARDGGWLVGPFDADARPTVVDPGDLASLPWDTMLRSLPDLAGLLIVTLVALLLNLSALETIRRHRVETSHELSQAGIANIAISVIGAIPVFHGLGDSVLAEKMGVRSRWVGIAAGGLCVGLSLVGVAAVGYVPLLVAGGGLMIVGIGLLVSWLRFLSGGVGLVGRMVSITVVLTIGFVGILEGVLLGLVLACAVFVLRYSRVDPIRRLTDGSESRSRVDRPAVELRLLAQCAHQTRVIELQGYMFFASATRLVDALRALVHGEDDVRWVVIDLRFVTGVEPGTAQVIAPLAEELRQRGVDIVVSGPIPSVVAAFQGPSRPNSFVTLDMALAFVEDQVLVNVPNPSEPDVATATGEGQPARPWLGQFGHEVLERGVYLMRVGDPADTLVYLISGVVSATAHSATGERHRIRRTEGPAWFGEIGFLRGSARTADVVAESTVECVRLDRAELRRLELEDPALAVEILRDIAVTAASRAASLTDALAAALD